MHREESEWSAAVASVLLTLIAAGCATPAHEIGPAYVSAAQMSSLSCDQVKGELDRIARRVADLSNLLDERSRSDQTVVALGFLFFTPIMLAVKGNGPEAVELARLKGERVALLQTATTKDCEEFRAKAIAFRVGDRLDYVDYDPIGGAVTGQQTLIVTELASGGGVVLNSGDNVLGVDGSWTSSKGGLEFDSVFRRDAAVGERWSATLRDTGQQAKARVSVRMLASEQYTTETASIPAHRLQIEGWAAGPTRNSFAGAMHGDSPVRGEIVVDAVQGMPLSISLDTKVGLSVKRALVRVATVRGA